MIKRHGSKRTVPALQATASNSNRPLKLRVNLSILVCVLMVALTVSMLLLVSLNVHETFARQSKDRPSLTASKHVQRDNFLSDGAGIAAAPQNQTLPRWMQDYMTWHSAQRAALTADNDREHRFLILRCLHVDKSCGGLSDRLKSLPLLLLFAAASKRILLIHWQRPAPLESFLWPAAAGDKFFLDWTMPAWMNANAAGSRHYTKAETLLKALSSDRLHRTVYVTVRIQDQHGGSAIYNALEQDRIVNNRTWPLLLHKSFSSLQQNFPIQLIDDDQRHFRRVFRKLWSVLFAPSPPLATAIRSQQERLGLLLQQQHPPQTNSVVIPYVAAHVRTYYGHHPIPPAQRREVAVNAVNCASTLRQQPPEPVVLVSDSHDILKAAAAYATPEMPIRTTSTTTTTTTTGPEPLHLDKASSRVAADYYDIFVDLYLLANARCISHGPGGFGRFGVLLSRDPSCFVKYFSQGQFEECDWKFYFPKKKSNASP